MRGERKELSRWMSAGAAEESPAADVLLPLIYDELRAAAHRAMAGEATGHTLQTTALVHEAYLKLGGEEGARWENRRHYVHAAALAMRRILVDHARGRDALKRGGGRGRVPLDEAELVSPVGPTDWVALDGALAALERRDEDLARLVLLRYFAGLSVEQCAAALGISASTAAREWRVARAFLERHLRESRA